MYIIAWNIFWNNQLTGFEVLKQPGVMMVESSRLDLYQLDVFIEVQVLRRAGEGVNVDETGNSEVCWW